MGVKLKDIARETGFSVSTVSRILSKDRSRKSSDQTVALVVETARKLGYLPIEGLRFIPSSEWMNRIFSIGCILTSEHETYVSPFFSSLLAGIQNEMAKTFGKINYHLFVMNIKDPGFWQFFESNKLDGGIMLGRTSLENIAKLREKIPNLMYSGLNKIGDDLDEVLCDAYQGFSFAVKYLVSLGHKKIGFIGPTQHKSPVFNEHRYRGFVDGMKEAGLALDESYVVDTILTSADGYDSTHSLIESRKLPTAILCGNDTVALGAMRAISESGLSIPDDISLMGFDNIDTAQYVKPTLTTIAVPTKDLGRIAVKLLFDKIENQRDYPIQINIPFKVIERESCKVIR